jgi:V/A-type H+-transporting ATPase subunit D
MARKLRLTRPELKRQRDSLARFTRYLPMLKLKQQQLQITMLEVDQRRREARGEVETARQRMQPYRRVLRDVAGVNVEALARPREVATHTENVAGVRIPVFDSVSFPPAEYSLFATPPWVDRALADLRVLNERQARLDVLRKQHDLIRKALTKIIQRVNLFEKVLVPRAREAIRVIRIHLGEEQTAAVGRAKLAKAKLAESPQVMLIASRDDREPAP